MKKKPFAALAWFVFVLAGPALLHAKTLPPEFSADMILLNKNKPFDEGKFYLGKSGGRLDLMKKAKQTQIFRFDTDTIEVWMHEGKMIMEMKMQYNALVDYKPEGFSEVCIGEEVMDGHPCQKCIMSGKFMGKNIKTTVWKAKDLRGMVIKNMDEEGNGTVIKNIALGPQSISLFQSPAGYRKMTLPAGMGDILKGFGN